MKIIITKDYDEMSKKAAELIASKIKENKNLVLGLATGATPIKTYENLVKKYNNKEISFKNVVTFNLDEYVGLKEDHHQSYRYFMNKNLFDHLDIDKKNTFIPLGTGNIKENALLFEKQIKKFGPVDLQILGIGINAHIGFNEPGSKENTRVQEVKLLQSTIDINKKKFFNENEQVPKTAISMGIENILESKSIILLASGKDKAKAIKNSIKGKIGVNTPGSFLQKHKDLTIIIDKDAASLL